MPDYKEMIATAKGYLKQAQEISLKTDASAEELQKADNLLNEAKSIQDRVAKLKEIELVGANIEAITEPEEAKAGKPSTKGKPGEFKDWEEFFLAVREEYVYKEVDPRLQRFYDAGEGSAAGARRAEKSAMSGESGALGGYLIPPDFLNNIMQIAAPLSIVRSRATVLPMSSRTLAFPVLDQTGTTAGKPAWFGGFEARWTRENTTRPQTRPAFKLAQLEAHMLSILSYIPDELLEDAPALAAWLGSNEMGLAAAIAWYEDLAFLTGTGVGTPLGVINAPATKIVNRATANRITYPDLVNMMAGSYGTNLVWVASISAMPQLLLMEGPSGNPSYLWGNATDGAPARLLNYPIYFDDKVPTLGTQGDIGLYDFGKYVIGDRRRTTIEMSKETAFPEFQTVIRGSHRVDGQPWLSKVLTLADGTTTVSPFVVLGDVAGT